MTVQAAGATASSAGLPASSACVAVGPVLFCSGPSSGLPVNTSPAAGATKHALDGATLWPYESMIVGYGAHESMMLLRSFGEFAP